MEGRLRRPLQGTVRWPMICPACRSENDDGADACFTCGKALHALTQGRVLASRYEILRPLGRGGMGMVYQAYDRVLEEVVAIKVVRSELTRDAETARRFRQEIKLARHVSHRNVCRINEYGEDGPVRFISMEYVDGVSLKEVARDERVPLDARLDLAQQVTRGLEAVHDVGVVHRDLKASNVMVDVQGLARLMDFGLAKVAGTETIGVGDTGKVVGTPDYMSPEQASGEPADFRSDLYSLGCVHYEIFTGDVPFHGETPVATLLMHLKVPPSFEGPRAAALPAPLVRVLRKALAKDPGQRFARAGDLAEALDQARLEAGIAEWTTGTPIPGVVKGPPVTRPAGPGPDTATLEPSPARGGSTRRPLPPRPTRPPRRRRALGVSVVAAGVLLAAWGLLRSGPDRVPAGAASTPSSRESPAPPAGAVEPGGTSTTPGSGGEQSTLPSRPVPRPRPAFSRSASGAVIPEKPATGILKLLIVPPAEVLVDGRSLGTVSLREERLLPGSHVVRVVHPDYRPLQRKVTVEAGIRTQLILDLAEQGIPKRP